jgi:hypothetical protein
VRGDRVAGENVVAGRIFISYRRSDDQSAAGRLYDRLLQHFDREQLFMERRRHRAGRRLREIAR